MSGQRLRLFSISSQRYGGRLGQFKAQSLDNPQFKPFFRLEWLEDMNREIVVTRLRRRLIDPATFTNIPVTNFQMAMRTTHAVFIEVYLNIVHTLLILSKPSYHFYRLNLARNGVLAPPADSIICHASSLTALNIHKVIMKLIT